MKLRQVVGGFFENMQGFCQQGTVKKKNLCIGVEILVSKESFVKESNKEVMQVEVCHTAKIPTGRIECEIHMWVNPWVLTQ